MDSLTQIVLGASVAAVAVPARHRRAALLAGGVLGTVPDLDSLVIGMFTSDPISLMILHRGVSHSLLVLPWVAVAIWALFLKFGNGRVRDAPKHWFWAIQLALVTHPVLDAMTVYGTQLWWPLPVRPTMWSNIFIIDPLYTIWLLLGVLLAVLGGARRWAGTVLGFGLLLSSLYLVWTFAAKWLVEREADRAFAAAGLVDTPRFSVPTPFNTLLWRVVVMTPEGYADAEYSLVARSPMTLRMHRSDVDALAQVEDFEAVRRLRWFNHGFMRADVVDEALVLSDIRMGMSGDYSFRFEVARRDEGGAWQALPPRQLKTAFVPEGGIGQATRALWHRVIHGPDAEVSGSTLGWR